MKESENNKIFFYNKNKKNNRIEGYMYNNGKFEMIWNVNFP